MLYLHILKELFTKTVKDIISVLKYIERKNNIDYKLDLISRPKNEKKRDILISSAKIIII